MIEPTKNIPKSIPKRSSEPAPDSFEALREEGLALAQQLSGEVWTDYNLHDPGVTILEQVCYALTDLGFRSDFPVEDHLAQPDGSIDYAGQSLHRPEAILPSGAWTVEDHRRVILDATPDADNIWFETANQNDADRTRDERIKTACPGLYLANVRLRDEVARHTVADQVRRNFSASRSLCEDLHCDVNVLEKLGCTLVGVIEVDGSHPPADVLGDIYYRAVLYIASNSRHDSPATAAKDDDGRFDAFDGPLVRHDRLPQDDKQSNEHVLLSTLVGIVQDVPGVVRVERLALAVGEEQALQTETVRRRQGRRALWLNVPKDSGNADGTNDPAGRLIVQKSGRQIDAPAKDAFHKFIQLISTAHEARSKPRRVADDELPSGTHRDFASYHAVRHHFPDTYGIGERGLAPSSTPARKVQADQLRAYLSLFDQVMANHLAQVDGLREFFADAVQPGPGPTYAVQALDDARDSDGRPLAMNDSVSFIAEKMARFDPAPERRSRQLDHMLALFGERFTQKSLRHFDHYSTSADHRGDIVGNKAALLRDVEHVTRDRVGGIDYFASDACGYAQRVCRLLGFRSANASSTAGLRARGIDLSDTNVESWYGDASARSVPDDDADVNDRVHALFQTPGFARRILARGTQTQRYRLDASESDDSVTVRLLSSAQDDNEPAVTSDTRSLEAASGSESETLDTCPSRDDAAGMVRKLSQVAAQLCRESECLHVLEHILLRPAAARPTHEGCQSAAPRHPVNANVDLWAQFYPLRFSVFFPNWTARCDDPAFRQLAEETVQINSPAHAFGQCFWLGFDDMERLEGLLTDWREAYRADGVTGDTRDEAAWKLIGFCLEQQRCDT